MKPSLSVASVTVGLSLAAAAAQAQTTITRQITSEPVETVITQNPNGTAISRRILTPEPGFSTMPPPNYVAPPLAGNALYPDYVEPLDTVTTRRVVASPPPVPPATVGVAPRAHTQHVVTDHARPARTATRTVARTVGVPPPPPPDAPLVLSIPERQVIYGAITGRQVYYPAPVYPPVVAETDYPVNTVYPADPYHDYGYRAPDYYHDHYVYRWDGVPLVIGGRMPPSVALYGVPDWVLARVPAAQGYGYARLDDRVYIVDPATAVIVAEIAP